MDELALYILDLLENALTDGATRLELSIGEDPETNLLTVELVDNGRGMAPDQVRRATSAFYTTRTTRRVGLGLSLLKALAEQCGGTLALASEPGKGTRVLVTMRLDHLDRPPLGDMGASIAAALSRDVPPDLVYRHRRGTREFFFSSSWLKEFLGDVPVNLAPVLAWVKDYINDGLKKLAGGNGVGQVFGGPSET